jgi:ATP-GRASP peptide maturase of grasp-with-spasm system
MILIISDQGDRTTNNVIYWLIFYGIEYIRINDTTDIKLSKFYFENHNWEINLLVKNEVSNEIIEIKYQNITAFWYRRGFFRLHQSFNLKFEENSEINFKDIHSFLNREWNAINNFFLFDMFDKTKSIGNHEHNLVNKLYTLKIASDLGLKIPESHLVMNKAEFLKLLERKEFITKPASDAGFIMLNESTVLGGYTHEVFHADVNKLDNSIYPTFIQEKIEKEFELRIFYLNPFFYASAIISQNDPKTRVDFRNYNKEHPNRILPYNLPNDVKTKLTNLLNKFNFNACSIDIIVDKKGDYYFLEINPVGQFEFIGHPCNYFLDNLVALELIKIKFKNIANEN